MACLQSPRGDFDFTTGRPLAPPATAAKPLPKLPDVLVSPADLLARLVHLEATCASLQAQVDHLKFPARRAPASHPTD